MTIDLPHSQGPWAYHISDNRDSEFEIWGDCSQIGTVERWDGDEDAELMAEAEANARLVTEAPMLLDAILDVKRLAGKRNDDGYDEETLLSLIEDRALKALRFINERSAA